MTRISLIAVLVAGTMTLATGCATKKYARNETAPTINKVNELDDLTAKNSRDIKGVDQRAQQGIAQVNEKASAADQKAATAAQAAQQAQQAASGAANGVNALTNTVANLDNYHAVTETTVNFAFNKADLTAKARAMLDSLASQTTNAQRWIIVVDGNADATGPADYNYQLSQRRAHAVVNYMAAKYGIQPYRFYFIGLGEDKPVAPNTSAKGRAENRRVDVRLMTSVGEAGAAAQAAPPQQ